MLFNNKPGSRIKRSLASFGIHPHFGCGCVSLANEMDKVGGEAVYKELDDYTDKMCESIKKWRKGKYSIIPQPPRKVIKSFISWACKA